VAQREVLAARSLMLLAGLLNGAIVAIPQQEGLKMFDWRIRHKDADGHDAQATLLCREAAIVQALFLERRQHCRVQIIEGPDGELIDRETFEREHLKRLRW
jgi:hypothetical protein